MAQVLKQSTIKRKAQEVEELATLINDYGVVAIAGLYKVRASQIQELAKRFRSDILMKVAKKALTKRALEKSEKKNMKELAEHVVGSNILLFTKMNPFKLSLLLEKNKIRMTVKAGDIAPNDIIIPAGNTGLPPGPAISELQEVGVRTRIEAGSVWISRETVVAKKDEIIQPKVASVLSKLGIKPLEAGLKIVAAYDDGMILTAGRLTLDLDEVRRQLDEASNQAFNLSLTASYPTTETIAAILQRAHLGARSLAVNSAYLATEVVADVLARAHSHMASLAFQLGKINKDAVPKEFKG